MYKVSSKMKFLNNCWKNGIFLLFYVGKTEVFRKFKLEKRKFSVVLCWKNGRFSQIYVGKTDGKTNKCLLFSNKHITLKIFCKLKEI
jgi:hypothetical protein